MLMAITMVLVKVMVNLIVTLLMPREKEALLGVKQNLVSRYQLVKIE